ncbi:hypothetical protein [Microvirga terricola]|uniref:Uncharacterized protein n=1 Tax=Microvirga terricola TaxID=2719797 RepID=A0ABX0V9S2_9HYPH|nr:hypothetical protein [Microvirga terricola]NIX75151.1 hypothetical protein [Microvirga terricola]
MKEKRKNRKETPRKRETRDRTLPENSQEALDRRLDEAEEESFPASDPVSVRITK